MGERQATLFRLDFNRSIRIEGRPERLTGDAGVLALRQIDHQLGLTEWLARHLIDPRNQELITHAFVELLRSRLYLIAQGWRDGDDADTHRFDAALRLAVSQRRGLVKAGRHDAARKYYKRIIKGYGDTTYARTAREGMANL